MKRVLLITGALLAGVLIAGGFFLRFEDHAVGYKHPADVAVGRRL